MILAYLSLIQKALYLHVIRRGRMYSVLAVLIVLFVPFLMLFVPTHPFPKGALVAVDPDASFGETAVMLEERGVISSAVVLKAIARVTGTDREVKAGRYVFLEPMGTLPILYRLVNGISGIAVVRVTFPEGSTVREMAAILEGAIRGFDAQAFIQEAKPYEGYLFPDTYDISIDATAEEIIARMRGHFDEKMEQFDLNHAREPLSRIITMASLLEKETKLGEDRRIVSGILWKRIAMDMPLQVDAVFGYIHDTDTYHPDLDDLEVESPYNTYRNRDLPPTPIANPGEDAIDAALYPNDSPYLYYLTGIDGRMYYAKTFDEHKRNKELYLR